MLWRPALEPVDIANKVVEIALNKQASDILMLDIRELSSFADYFVIGSGDSERQINAICDEIDEELRKGGVKVHRREGRPDSGWVLLDLGPVIVHIFVPRQRGYYELEKLWHRATPVVRIL